MAGLLITPAIVAQAGEVHANDEVQTGEEQQTKTALQLLEELVKPLLPENKEKLTSQGIEEYKTAVATAVKAITNTSTASLAKNNRLPVSKTDSKTIYSIIRCAEPGAGRRSRQ